MKITCFTTFFCSFKHSHTHTHIDAHKHTHTHKQLDLLIFFSPIVRIDRSSQGEDNKLCGGVFDREATDAIDDDDDEAAADVGGEKPYLLSLAADSEVCVMSAWMSSTKGKGYFP